MATRNDVLKELLEKDFEKLKSSLKIKK
jgi:hypothetical protein